MNLSIGEKIKQLRRDNDVTQEKFADYLNISHQAISKWESGTTCGGYALLKKLCKTLAIIKGTCISPFCITISFLSESNIQLSNLQYRPCNVRQYLKSNN